MTVQSKNCFAGVNLRYVHTKPDKFENATFFFYPDRPSVHTKTAFSVSKNGTFWKRSSKWINLKTPAKWVSADSENGTFWKRWCHNSHVTLSPSLLNHWSKMADELLIIDYGQRNSLKTILNVDGEHFMRFRGKSCVFKFIRLSVDVALGPVQTPNFSPNLDRPKLTKIRRT